MSTAGVTMIDAYLARQRITCIAKRTPLIHSPVLTESVGGYVCLKLESLQ